MIEKKETRVLEILQKEGRRAMAELPSHLLSARHLKTGGSAGAAFQASCAKATKASSAARRLLKMGQSFDASPW